MSVLRHWTPALITLLRLGGCIGTAETQRTMKTLGSPALPDTVGPERSGSVPSRFVTVDGTDFTVNGAPHHYLGVNRWYAMNLGATTESGNMWSWSGEAQLADPGAFWGAGNPFTGDRSPERQGEYGIYDTDTTTLRFIDRNPHRMAVIGPNPAPEAGR